jgi:hypothetical protein
MKGVQWMNCLPLSLKRLCGGGLGRISFTGDTRRYFQEVAGCVPLFTGNPGKGGVGGSYDGDFDG